jgi:LacI family transcriptional regulator
MSSHLRLPQVLLLVETSREYGRGLVEGIARYAEECGPWSIHFEERGLADPLPRWLKDWRGDGIISRTIFPQHAARLLATGLPVVELFAQPERNTPVVRPNDETIARLATEHFLDRGLRHLAFFCTARAHWASWREQAFERLVRKHGCDYHVFRSTPQERTAKVVSRPVDDRVVIRWVSSLPQPCGVFCATDIHAMQLIRSCQGCGIAVPEQIAVLGVDNDPVICRVCYPQLSSVDLGSTRIGYEAARLLDRMMRGSRSRQEDVCVEPVQIVTRQSTDTLAINDPEVASAVRLIREQACRRVRVADIANALAMSRRSLEQRFQAVLHRYPQQELIRVRMERAKTLLSDSDASIASVAKTSGFTSLAYFSRAFRRHAGMTPREYRRERRLGSDSERP